MSTLKIENSVQNQLLLIIIKIITGSRKGLGSPKIKRNKKMDFYVQNQLFK